MWCANANWVCQSALLADKTKRSRHIYGSSSFILKMRSQFPSQSAIHTSFHLSCGNTVSPDAAESQGSKFDSGFVWPSPNDKTPFWEKEFPSWDVSNSGYTVLVEKDSDPIHITHVTAEMAPIAKVGGLADVVTGLARACLLRGHKVDIMLPFYECIHKNHIMDLQVIATFSSYHDGEWIPVQAYHGTVSGIPVIFLDPSNRFFKGTHVYGGSYNELEAYLFFSRACLEYMQITGTQPDIIHVHEWQTSALPLLYWDMYQYLSLKKPRIVLTVHNMEHYGECTKEQLSKSGLDGAIYATVEKAIDDRTIGHNPERLSLLKGGVVYSNSIVTVSSTYLMETLCSGWLASTLIRNRDKYSGILNGIDTAMWNPASDVFLPVKFDATLTSVLRDGIDIVHISARDLEGKKTCKQYVKRGLGLALESSSNKGKEMPLVVCITRLVAQKGLHLITHAVNSVKELGGQLVILGKAPDAKVENDFKRLADLHNQGPCIRILLMYSEELSHMLYAAADIVFVPSIYEPCGLAQMIGMRYGAVPVVRRTGGLADTVFDLDGPSNSEMANGFVFDGIDEGSLDRTLRRAFSYYQEKTDEWNIVVRKIMEYDNSWNKTAGKYIEVYNSIRVR